MLLTTVADRQLAAVQYGAPLMGTVMDVEPESPPFVNVAVTVTAPETGSLAAGTLMSNLPASCTEQRARN